MAIKIKQMPSIFLLTTLLIVISQSAFSNSQWTTEECRNCHDNYKGLSLKASNSDLHHYLTGKEIRPLGANVPNAEASSKGLYDCMTCHPIGNSAVGYLELLTERDCLKCHKQEGTRVSDRHHTTVGASTNYDCASCHFRLPRLQLR